MKVITPGTILYLNGVSSSGKSSIAKELQKLFDLPFLHVEMDSFFNMLPKRFCDPTEPHSVEGLQWIETHDEVGPVVEIKLGKWGRLLCNGMYEAIAALAREGNNCIVDDVWLSNESYLKSSTTLKEFKVYYIGIKCPLHILEQREKERKDRVVTTARGMYSKVHTFGTYDYEVDSSLYSAAECAKRIKNYIFLQETSHGYKE